MTEIEVITHVLAVFVGILIGAGIVFLVAGRRLRLLKEMNREMLKRKKAASFKPSPPRRGR